ncbi:DUF6398 domain-containing protein [Pseudonocardia acaciae]|uniref:DUF6398 domain-containing protein n=1 Tax=Pseudonocardia acaciae TaxID=551276 RepID=UPI00048E0E95|nr:DUF6398 domain-containing protein [Pseudonocardia acaciae]
MAKRTRPGAGRPRRVTPASGHVPNAPHAEREPDLLDDVRNALADEDPLSFLSLASTLFEAIDPRNQDPFASDHDDLPASHDQLVRSFLDVRLPETSALLAAIAELTTDELLRARIGRELATRAHPLPRWLATLHDAEVGPTSEVAHVLGDGDDIVLGVRLATGHELSVLVYVDHNLGTVVKDAFVVSEPFAEFLDLMMTAADDPDTTCTPLDPADARARVTEAVEQGIRIYPPLESDTWPACRPLVEWAVRRLPTGGTGYVRPDWSDRELAGLAGRFFGSEYGRGLDDRDHRALLDSLLWFGIGYGPGDPLRWSPVAVEILLVDWIPRKIVATTEYLAKAPELLRAFIRFCHRERDIRAELTEETLAAVDDYEPDYLEIIRMSRPRGPAALLEAMGTLYPPGSEPGVRRPDEEFELARAMLEWVRIEVGGQDAMESLDDAPLPDEPFDWTGVPGDIAERVGEVLGLLDEGCEALFGMEARTAARRVLARAVAGDPAVFRRRARAATAAAAVCWIVAKANHLFSMARPGRMAKDLHAHFGLRQSSSQRAHTLLRAAGFDDDFAGDIVLGSPEYLTSERRRVLIELRDTYRERAGVT